MYSLADLAPMIQAKIVGSASFQIEKLASLAQATPSQLSFVNGEKYVEQAQASQAGALIVTQALYEQLQSQASHFLIVENPYLAFAILTHVFEEKVQKQGIEPTAQIDPTARIASTAYIGANVVIGANCVVGEHSIILANTVLADGVQLGEHCLIESNVSLLGRCQLGNRVRIHANTVIGGEGFGFAPYQGKWHRIAQLGSVRIGHDVRIGSNCSIDRGALDDTIIEDGVVIDNLVQIAHNVHIGANTAIAAKTGIAGSTKIGKNCVLAGDCGVVGHITIADHVTLTAQAMVTKSILKAGTYSSGTGVFEVAQWKKAIVKLRQLADLPLTQLVKKVDDMHAKLESKETPSHE
ncbi:MAG: UDP-3-O-(3-hydroxymyristoyl)glucosamine N-acyltransferase [Acinetobacter sp.]|nr:UDP-3-O-(3-hydroxymyristoyl)glucosamine N-acyltransferase [Acinetobacter sp.]